ncbi:MAG TPA: hypothetical protein VK207_11820 [Bacteroidales bacterium]|nr:hypothetical protein [Bacteroidales bacterium]
MRTFFARVIVLAGILSLACTTKVSEWVLLNADPGRYTLVFFHKNAPAGNLNSRNELLAKSFNGANITFRDVVKDDAVQPYYALYYGSRLFSRYDDPEQLDGLVSSPAREKIAGEIMKGKLCVMVYLNSGIKEKDEKGMAELKKAIAASPYSAIVPVVSIDRNDPAEKHFISMLLNVEADLKGFREPMLFGVFGKFKALEPLVSNGITAENVNYMLEFLTADCSCLIKDDLPGTDILYSGKWDAPATAMVNAILDANPSLMHQ